MKSLKQALRQRIRAQRLQVDVLKRQSYSQKIAHFLFQRPSFRQSQRLALYLPFAGEVSTILILNHALNLQKSCYLPVVRENRLLQFTKIDRQTQLVPNRFGILEPFPVNVLRSASTFDLILLPLVAFDRTGRRLGMGQGFYDVTLQGKTHAHLTLKPRLIGLAFDCQKVNAVPSNELDVGLDEVITEKRVYTCST